MKDKRLKLLAAPAMGMVIFAALFFLLDRYASYRSPLYGAEPEWVPRLKAKRDLAEWAAKKVQDEARLAEILKNLDTEKMVELGKEIVHGRGLCFNCHKIGEEGRGTQGPNLEGAGARAGSRRPGMSDVDYLAQSLYQPDAFIVPGFNPAMTPANKPPIGLSDLEILMVMAYLQSLGGTATVTPDTRLPYAAGATAQSR